MTIALISYVSNAKANLWEYKSINYKGMSLKLVQLNTIDTKAIQVMIEIIDKSAESKEPMKLQSNYRTMFGSDDLICVSNKLVLWFSVSEKNKGRTVRSAGGLLAGAWELDFDEKTKVPTLKKMVKETMYAPNALLPGSEPGAKLFGADAYGGYPGSKAVWTLENAQNVRITTKTGRSILSVDRGPFSADEGVFIQFKGIVGNSGLDTGIDSLTDTDPRPGVIGRTEYTLTYRVPAHRSDFIQEIDYKSLENNFGPISNAYMSLYLAGNAGKPMVYAANPELMPKTEGQELANVQINKYFKNSCVKKIFFYDVSYRDHKGTKLSAQVPEGRGRLACVGSPENKVSFLCAYPNNDYIPKNTYEEYTIEIVDNQTVATAGKVTAVNYKLITSPNKSVTIKQGESLLLIIRYKFIDAQVALPEGYIGGNLRKRKTSNKPKIGGAPSRIKRPKYYAQPPLPKIKLNRPKGPILNAQPPLVMARPQAQDDEEI
jgi:hypothetical protein